MSSFFSTMLKSKISPNTIPVETNVNVPTSLGCATEITPYSPAIFDGSYECEETDVLNFENVFDQTYLQMFAYELKQAYTKYLAK